MRLGIDGVADRGEFAEHLAWVAILEQRAVAAPADALDEGRDVGVEPQRQAVLQDQCTCLVVDEGAAAGRSEEHTSELQSLMRISYAVFCLKKKNTYRVRQL